MNSFHCSNSLGRRLFPAASPEEMAASLVSRHQEHIFSHLDLRGPFSSETTLHNQGVNPMYTSANLQSIDKA